MGKGGGKCKEIKIKSYKVEQRRRGASQAWRSQQSSFMHRNIVSVDLTMGVQTGRNATEWFKQEGLNMAEMK